MKTIQYDTVTEAVESLPDLYKLGKKDNRDLYLELNIPRDGKLLRLLLRLVCYEEE